MNQKNMSIHTSNVSAQNQFECKYKEYEYTSNQYE